MNQKILSIIIPMYNSKSFIAKCLDSLIVSEQLQDYLDIIVVNDGSTDGCEHIAEQYVHRFPHMIRTLNKENGGHGSAINHGLFLCEGTYFKVLDADDWVETDELEKLLRILPTLEPCDVVTCHFHTFDIRTAQRTPIRAQMTHSVEYVSMEQLMERWMQVRHVFWLHGMIYRRDFYLKVNKKLPENIYYDDGYFITVAASVATRFCLLDQYLEVYRIGDQTQSVSNECRIARISHEKEVLRAILATHDDKRTPAGMEYWYFKTCAGLTNIFITTLLRHTDRWAGRTEAHAFWKEIRASYPDVARRVRKRYYLLAVLHALHISERSLQAFMRLRK